jgi:hypothetical protein
MNYKEMLEQFEALDKRLNYQENEIKYLRERILKLEGNGFFDVPKKTEYNPGGSSPRFTEGTYPHHQNWFSSTNYGAPQ